MLGLGFLPPSSRHRLFPALRRLLLLASLFLALHRAAFFFCSGAGGFIESLGALRLVLFSAGILQHVGVLWCLSSVGALQDVVWCLLFSSGCTAARDCSTWLCWCSSCSSEEHCNHAASMSAVQRKSSSCSGFNSLLGL
jgi:hypothetical protein